MLAFALATDCGVRPASAQLLIDTVVGGANGDGFDAALARFSPADIVFDAAGNILVADSTGNRIRRIDRQTNLVSTIAGIGTSGFSGDNGPATQAKLFFPTDIVLDSQGNIYFSDQLNHRVRRIAAGSGVITTVAGNGQTVYNGDNIPAVEAALSFPSGLALLGDGSLLIADAGNNRVRRVAQGFITTVAGTSQFGYNGDGIPANTATLTTPSDLAVDGAGNILIADNGNCRIRLVQAQSQFISTFAGVGMCGSTGNGGPATAARLNGPSQLALRGNILYFLESLAPRVRSINLDDNIIQIAAGNGQNGLSPDGGLAIQSRLDSPSGLAVDSDNRLLIGENGSGRIRRVHLGVIDSIAGDANGDGFQAALAKIDPKGIARGPAGALIIADSSNNRLRRVPPSFNPVSTAAGTGTFGYGGDNGPATQALLGSPLGVAVDTSGNIVFSDQLNHRIRRIAVSGTITTIAGTGTPSFGGDGGPATAAGLSFPAGLAFAPNGDLYIADASNNRIRRIEPNGRITTVVGTGSVGYNGDGIPASSAFLSNPTDVLVDTDSNLYIADRNSCRIRRVDGETDLISTVAGTGRCGYSGDGGPAVLAQLNGPEYLALLENRHLYFSESFTPRVRRVDLFTGIVTRVAGNGLPGSTGDGGPGLDAKLEMPAGLVLDKAQSLLFISDNAAGRVRRLQVETVPPSSFTPTRTRTFTPTPTATVTLTRTFTQTFTPSNTPTQTPTFTFTNTRTFTLTPTITSTITRTFTPSPTFTHSFTATRTDTATPTHTAVFTATQSFTVTASVTRTRTATATNTPSPTSTSTVTLTRTVTETRTPTSTPTRTSTPVSTLTRTPTVTGVFTATATPSLTRTATPTAQPPTASPSPTLTATPRPATSTPTTAPPTATRTSTPVPPSTSTSGPATSTATAVPPATLTRTATRTSTSTVSGPSATSTPTSVFTRTQTRTATAIPGTATRTRTSTQGQATQTPKATQTFPPGGTPTFTLRPTLTPTITRTATSTITPSATRTRPGTQLPTATRTSTSLVAGTATFTPRLTPSSVPSSTRTATRTMTPVVTFTALPTFTFTVTPRGSSTRSASPTITRTPVTSATRTPTITPTPPSTQTRTRTPTITLTRTPTSTRTFTTGPPPPTTAVPATPTNPPTATRTSPPTATRTVAFCVGDCNGDRFVTAPEVNAVVTRVNMCGGVPTGVCGGAGTCVRGDQNLDGMISAAELQRALEHAQDGCPQ